MPVPHQTGRCKSGDLEIFYRRLGNRALTPIYWRSKIAAMPWPPPMHMVTSA